MPEIDITEDGVQVTGYLAAPDGAKAGLIVIQEWWGLNDDIRGIADRYAAEGYVSIAPDLYHGTLASEPDEAQKLMGALDRNLASREIDAAISYLKSEHGVTKVGVTGFCMGGGLTLAAAARPTSTADAAHAYYGVPFLSPDELATVHCPVMASFGGEDAFTPADQITALEQGLTAAGVENDVKVYEGAGHGFFNSGGGHHEAAAADSWDRALSWFGRHLS